MQIFLLTALTMVAFAANSVLNRAGVVSGGLSAEAFGIIRLCAGAVMLGALVLWQRRALKLGGENRVAGVVSLLVYIFGFSLAYTSLDSGTGALILFGMVQVTMFVGGLLTGERPPALRWIGAGLAFGGLIWLLWPDPEASISLVHGAAMAAAGIGWGVYSLIGRNAKDALQSTAANFIIASGFACVGGVVLQAGSGITVASAPSILLAVVSGAMTSGLGYALWYKVLPSLPGTVAAVAQLTVPVIATAGGVLFLSEVLSVTYMIASVIVLGGVALSAFSTRN